MSKDYFIYHNVCPHGKQLAARMLQFCSFSMHITVNFGCFLRVHFKI